jgi:hypothetical protein
VENLMLEDWQNNDSNLKKHVFTNREKQTILGALLGNASIIKPKKSKYPHFQMRESISKGGVWLRCKAFELQRFSRPKSFVADKDSYRWNSVSCECWEYLQDLCYKKGNKQVTMEWLDQLQDYGIACWWMDKGALTKNHASLRISRLDKKSVENIQKYFEIIGIPGEIKNFGGSKIIAFKEKNMFKFMQLIGQKLPLYKRLQIN